MHDGITPQFSFAAATFKPDSNMTTMQDHLLIDDHRPKITLSDDRYWHFGPAMVPLREADMDTNIGDMTFVFKRSNIISTASTKTSLKAKLDAYISQHITSYLVYSIKPIHRNIRYCPCSSIWLSFRYPRVSHIISSLLPSLASGPSFSSPIGSSAIH